MEKDKASTPNKGKDIHVGSDSDFETESDSDIEMATEDMHQSNMDEDKASTPNKGSASEIEMARDYGPISLRPAAGDYTRRLRSSGLPQARASNMEEDKYIKMATDILTNLDYEITSMSSKASRIKRISHCCIYRVPQALRDVNWKAYTPALILIGPFHRRNISAMGREKLRYFEKLTERNGMDKKKMCDIVISIKNQEDYLRYCYSGKFNEIKSNDFVEMILLDAVFIIEFFLESNDEKGPKSFKPRMTFDIREDLMLLENQLPVRV